ncbi:hypothetical protein KC316_g3464 [Hortaea werneckii]|nr:hypothetical protein KC324_g3432 [Hortaea werneckii]KAI7590284.1 hypothetical protein KC316_g3464 [Hortaea werneckii]
MIDRSAPCSLPPGLFGMPPTGSTFMGRKMPAPSMLTGQAMTCAHLALDVRIKIANMAFSKAVLLLLALIKVHARTVATVKGTGLAASGVIVSTIPGLRFCFYKFLTWDFSKASDPSGFRAAKLLPRASTYTVRSLAESITPSDSDEDRPSSPALRSLPRSRSIPTDPGLGLNDDDFIRDFNQRLRSQDDEEADEFVMSGGLNGLDGIEFRDGGAESNRKHDQGIIYDPAPDDSDHDSSDDEDPDDGKDAHDSSGDAIEEVRQSHHKRQREPIVIDSSDESSDDLSDEEDVDLYKRLRDLFRMKPSNDPSGDSTDSENESTPKRRRLTPARDQGDIGNSNGRAYRARSRTATSLTAVPEASNAAQQLQGTRTLSNHNQQFTSTRPITSFVYADMVFRGHKFTRGEITQGQLDFLRTRSFDKDAIDWVGNEWRHAMHEREKELRTEALDFYKADGRRFLNKYLVPRVCPVSMGSL